MRSVEADCAQRDWPIQRLADADKRKRVRMSTEGLRYLDLDSADYEWIAESYNALVQGVCHCHPVDAGRVEREFHAESDRYSAQEVIIAADGFAHVAIRTDKHNRPGSPAVIRFLAFPAESYRTGLSLIRAAEQWSRERGATRIGAFFQGDTYGFYHSPPACLSDRIGHVQALFQVTGYRRSRGEVFLDAYDFPVTEPEKLESRYRVTVEHEETEWSRPSFSIRIFDGDQPAGVCKVIPRESFGGFEEESDWLFYSWVGVEDAYQRRGLGRYLVRKALEVGREAGYRHASISTALDNDRAFVLYTSERLRVVDWTYGWEKPL